MRLKQVRQREIVVQRPPLEGSCPTSWDQDDIGRLHIADVRACDFQECVPRRSLGVMILMGSKQSKVCKPNVLVDVLAMAVGPYAIAKAIVVKSHAQRRPPNEAYQRVPFARVMQAQGRVSTVRQRTHLRSKRVRMDELVDPRKAGIEMPYRVSRHHANPLVAPELLQQAKSRKSYYLVAKPRLAPDKDDYIRHKPNT
ncbi:hypothetical protein G6F57_015929 [Rhizopus arrhizus]|nr:hypothetical protein G6F57_015929 [Rhizopus arrhizus]